MPSLLKAQYHFSGTAGAFPLSRESETLDPSTPSRCSFQGLFGSQPPMSDKERHVTPGHIHWHSTLATMSQRLARSAGRWGKDLVST